MGEGATFRAIWNRLWGRPIAEGTCVLAMLCLMAWAVQPHGGTCMHPPTRRRPPHQGDHGQGHGHGHDDGAGGGDARHQEVAVREERYVKRGREREDGKWIWRVVGAGVCGMVDARPGAAWLSEVVVLVVDGWYATCAGVVARAF